MGDAELIARTEVFADSDEIARNVLKLPGDYWPAEAHLHIVGLWKHAKELTEALAKHQVRP